MKDYKPRYEELYKYYQTWLPAGSQHPDFLQRPSALLSDPERYAEARHYTVSQCRCHSVAMDNPRDIREKLL
ncbi:hypothetical protein IES07_002540 [Salmonella enterica subsp. enterica serovar Stanley]|nr:hypothetical protein [Salmonella enterica subsp. enterica serovar Stanley]